MLLALELTDWIDLAITLAVAAVVLAAARYVLDLRERKRAGRRFQSQAVMFALTSAALLAVVVALPLEPENKGLLGLILSGAIALASTSVLGHVMGGLVLRMLRNFQIGDFVRCEGHFGRVTERGLFHTEIQTEERDLTTIPNLFLVTHPVSVIRSSGTIVSASVSLGYDVPRTRVRELLLEAGAEAGLEEPFVQVSELGDFSITYRVAGLLKDVKGLITARSRLRAHMLDTLHGGGVEIVSPTFMNQRVLAAGFRAVPRSAAARSAVDDESALESLAFDKAEQAASVEALRKRQEELVAERAELEKLAKVSKSDDAAHAEAKLRQVDARLERLRLLIEERERELKDEGEGA